MTGRHVCWQNSADSFNTRQVCVCACVCVSYFSLPLQQCCSHFSFFGISPWCVSQRVGLQGVGTFAWSKHRFQESVKTISSSWGKKKQLTNILLLLEVFFWKFAKTCTNCPGGRAQNVNRGSKARGQRSPGVNAVKQEGQTLTLWGVSYLQPVPRAHHCDPYTRALPPCTVLYNAHTLTAGCCRFRGHADKNSTHTFTAGKIRRRNRFC